MSIVAKKDDASVRVRFPQPVLSQLDESAAKEGRSRNSQIIKLVNDGLQRDRKKNK
jgi:metal-responsive CopG/Arc/MetJ family transcriptional regulator